MTLTPTDLAALATLTLMVIVVACLDDPRAWHWAKAQFSRSIGIAWFAGRRMRRSINRGAPL